MEGSSASRPVRRLNTRTRLLAAAILGCYAAAPAMAQLPTGMSVQYGTATSSQTGNLLTVTNSNGAVLHWDSFSIGKGYTTYFAQPSASSAVLNRVVGASPSQIYGTLSSNGKVWLINPNGITIGPGGLIDTAAFVGSTLDVSNANFLAGKLSFEKTPNAGDVVNQGTIKTASGGSVYLIGANVKNETVAGYQNDAGVNDSGLIQAPNGEVILASGETVELIDTGTPGVKVEITGAVGNTTNLGTVLAEAGRIGLAGVIVKNSGTLNASSVVNEGGRIFLKASQDTYVDGNGRIVATGTKGGRVEVLGNRVAVMDNAVIDVSGVTGGGTILVGGDYQGKNPDIQNASITYFGPNAKLKADATDNGDGGKVIVWSDDTTRAYGSISARGGANGGNGGFVETSGHRYLDFHADVDRRAPYGQAGTLLLDPSDVTIDNSTTSYGSSFAGGIFTSSSGTSTLTWTDIISQLGGGNVVITTSGSGGTGNITINASPYGGSNIAISHTDSWGSWSNTYYGAGYNSSNSLSLLANNAVNINAWFGNVGTGAINIMAGWDGVSTSSPTMGSYAAGKSIKINSGGGIASMGSVTLKAADSVEIRGGNTAAGIDLNTGALTVIANKILLAGGSVGYNNARAFIQTNGSQSFTVGTHDSSGGLFLQGGGGSNYGNSAEIDSYGTSSSQSFTIENGATVQLTAGNGSGTVPSGQWSGECSYGGCSGNAARIENGGAGAQTFNFVSGGSLALYGGQAGADNSANISSRGAQTISSGGLLNVSLIGGKGGAVVVDPGGISYTFDNSASIDSDTSQTINAGGGMLLMNGGGDASTFGGAHLGAPVQKLSFGTALLTGGNSNMQDKDGFGAPVAIGQKKDANVTLDVGTLIIMGGAGTSSPVGIGSLYGSAAVDINSSAGVLIYSGVGGVGIGSIGQALAPGAAGGVYLAYGTSITAPSLWIAADASVFVNGGLTATGGSFSWAAAAGLAPGTYAGLNVYAGLGGSGNITLGPLSSLSGNPINLVANGGNVIDNRTSAVTTQTTSSILTAILSSTTGGMPPPPIVIPPPPTGGGSGGSLFGGGSVGGGDNEFGGGGSSGGGSAGSSEGSNGSGGKDKDKSGNSGNGKDDKSSGKKSVGRCNA